MTAAASVGDGRVAAGGGSSAAAPHRFEVLDSLRGICACMIVVLHFGTPGAISGSTFVRHSFLFVDFFFVLSGFVIAASYGDRLAGGFSIGRFLALRMGRIYPLHLAMLLAFLAFELAMMTGVLGASDRRAFEGANTPQAFVASLFLVQTFVGPDNTFWNGPSWSIAVEMWTYLIFALGFRFARRWLAPLALLLAAGCCLYLGLLTDRYLNVFHDGALARCLYGFALGIVAFQLHRRWSGGGILPAPMMWTGLELVAVAATIGMIVLAGAGPLSLAIPPLFFCVVLLFAQQRGAVSRLLQRTPFLFLGTLSYSIYMVHGFLEYRTVNVLALIDRLSHGRTSLVAHDGNHSHIGGSPAFGDMMSIVMLLVAIGCAYVTYHLIERPGQRWSRGLILGNHPRRTTVLAEREAPTF